jgi:oxygen-independent coproporphyrinogen-3 oxidase
MKASQRLFKEEDIPFGDFKRRLYEVGAEALKNSRYLEIGMDHFAKPNEDLSLALKAGRLHRNFMGYTPHKSVPIIGLGVSAIGDSGSSFWQNSKELGAYNNALSEGHLPYEKGHILTDEDKEIRDQILNIMTKYSTDWSRGASWLDEELMQSLCSFESDGLINLRETGFVVTETGKRFVRNLGMAFDKRLKKSKSVRPIFSRTV